MSQRKGQAERGQNKTSGKEWTFLNLSYLIVPITIFDEYTAYYIQSSDEESSSEDVLPPYRLFLSLLLKFPLPKFKSVRPDTTSHLLSQLPSVIALKNAAFGFFFRMVSIRFERFPHLEAEIQTILFFLLG